MRLVPEGKADKVAFFQSKIAPWASSATQIGTTTAAVTDLQAKVAAAQEKLAEQVAAEQAAKAATQAANHAVDAAAAAGADIIRAIRARAAVAGSSVYELAEIPGPATPRPVNALGQPAGFKVGLGADGALTLSWKCANPRATGAMYEVWRSLGGVDAGASFAYVGGTGSKSFVDATVPAGTASVVYRVRSVRSTAAGPWAVFTVLLGASAGGGQTALVRPKRAA